MKLKEKLWKDIQANSDELGICCTNCFREGFIAGFEKAKELALMPEHGYEGPFISGTSIKELGEQEVNE